MINISYLLRNKISYTILIHLFFALLGCQLVDAKEFGTDTKWPYQISELSVGNISTDMLISDIPSILPNDYYMLSYSMFIDDDDEEQGKFLIYRIVHNNNTEIIICPNLGDSNQIYSLDCLSPKYRLQDSGLKIGDTYNDLLINYEIVDYYFDLTNGLYVYCKDSEVIFEIDLENKGDEFENLSTLNEAFKIKSIAIYTDQHQIE